MVRSFVVKDEKTGKPTLRKPRKKVLLRGTLRYCSVNVHKRMEQGRCDDLWSLLYMLIELFIGLPWSGIKEEEPLQKMKVNYCFLETLKTLYFRKLSQTKSYSADARQNFSKLPNIYALLSMKLDQITNSSMIAS